MAKAQIDAYIAAAPAWQRDNLVRFRAAVHRVAPMPRRGGSGTSRCSSPTAAWCAPCRRFAKHTKYNFFNGAALADPHHLFNSGLDSKKSRSINLAEGESVDAAQLDELIREAFAAGA